MRGTKDVRAWRAYLRGETLYTTLDEKQMKRAISAFRRSTKLDPQFGRAWGYLSYCLMRSVMEGWFRAGKVDEAEQCARLAVALEPYDYATHWDLAFVYLNTGRHTKGLNTYRRALRLYDTMTDALDRKPGLLVEMADALSFLGHYEQARTLIERAHRIPDWYRWNDAWLHFQQGDFDAAIEALDAMYRKPGDPRYPPNAQLLLAAAHWCVAEQSTGSERRSRRAKARAAIRRCRARNDRECLAAERRRVPFRDERAREHWLGVLRAAGLPE